MFVVPTDKAFISVEIFGKKYPNPIPIAMARNIQRVR
jgi:hypothetical protein